ncbi:hypothetical protein, partial [Thalassovita aquimarina]|uniref:hypothetical protein n=1 Tax=Thalassovita aquimarina TaxID=2785917 RepID=UPI0035675871
FPALIAARRAAGQRPTAHTGGRLFTVRATQIRLMWRMDKLPNTEVCAPTRGRALPGVTAAGLNKKAAPWGGFDLR